MKGELLDDDEAIFFHTSSTTTCSFSAALNTLQWRHESEGLAWDGGAMIGSGKTKTHSIEPEPPPEHQPGADVH